MEVARTCIDCRLELPLTEEFFQKQRRGNSHTCRACRYARAGTPLPTLDCKRCLRRFPRTDEFFMVNPKTAKLTTTCKECKAGTDHRRWENSERERRQSNAEDFKERRRQHHAKNREREISRSRERQREVRQEAIAAYGGKCECCGETHIEFLGIDHVNNDGHEHRRSGIGGNIYFWLRKNGFPKDGRFRALCHNCNMSRAMYGGCPHEGPVPYVSLARTLNDARRLEDRKAGGW